MKTTSVFTLIIISNLLLPVSVVAQGPSDPTSKPGLFQQWQQKRQEVRQEMVESRQEVREEIREQREDVKTEIGQQKAGLKGTVTQERNQFRIQRLMTSHNGLYKSLTIRARNLERYQKIISDRITQKLLKLPGNQSLLDAQAKLAGDELKSLWTKYSSDLAKYDASKKNIESSSDPKSLLSELKSQAKDVNEDLKDIRQFLVDSLRSLIRAR